MDFDSSQPENMPDGVDDELPDESRFDFSSDEAARESMETFIRENFSDLLGDKIDLLDEPNGVEKIKQAMQEEIDQASSELPQNLRRLMELLK
jgi:hypothetical protein